MKLLPVQPPDYEGKHRSKGSPYSVGKLEICRRFSDVKILADRLNYHDYKVKTDKKRKQRPLKDEKCQTIYRLNDQRIIVGRICLPQFGFICLRVIIDDIGGYSHQDI